MSIQPFSPNQDRIFHNLTVEDVLVAKKVVSNSIQTRQAEIDNLIAPMAIIQTLMVDTIISSTSNGKTDLSGTPFHLPMFNNSGNGITDTQLVISGGSNNNLQLVGSHPIILNSDTGTFTISNGVNPIFNANASTGILTVNNPTSILAPGIELVGVGSTGTLDPYIYLHNSLDTASSKLNTNDGLQLIDSTSTYNALLGATTGLSLTSPSGSILAANGNVTIPGTLTLPNGAVNGNILTSDGSGNASWAIPPSSGGKSNITILFGNPSPTPFSNSRVFPGQVGSPIGASFSTTAGNVLAPSSPNISGWTPLNASGFSLGNSSIGTVNLTGITNSDFLEIILSTSCQNLSVNDITLRIFSTTYNLEGYVSLKQNESKDITIRSVVQANTGLNNITPECYGFTTSSTSVTSPSAQPATSSLVFSNIYFSVRIL
jgi:hypothetical protein